MDAVLAFTLNFWVWRSLPHGDSAWDLLETTAPFTITDVMNTGGTVTGGPARAGRDAASWTQTGYWIGLLDVTDLARGGDPLVYPALSMAEVRAVLPYVRPGVAVALDPRTRERGRHGAASLTIAPFAAGAPSGPPPVAALRSLWQADVAAGSEVAHGRVPLFASALITRSSHLERGEPEALPGDVTSFTGRAMSSHGTLFGWAQQTDTAFAGRSRFAARDVTDSRRYAGATGAWQVSRTLPLRIEAGLQRLRASPAVDASTANGTIERLVDGPVPALVAESPSTRTRWSIAASAGSREVHRNLLILTGGISRVSADTFPAGAGVIGERVDGTAARAWRYGLTDTTHHHETIVSVSGGDNIFFSRAFVLAPAVRLEHLSASNGAFGVGWTNVAPSLSARVSWRAWTFDTMARRTLLQVPLSVLDFGDPAGPSGEVFRWTDANGDGRADAAEIGPLIAFAGPGASSTGRSAIDPSIRRPTSDDLLLTAKRSLGSDLTMTFGGITRRERNRFAALDTGVPPSAYTVSTIADPGLDLLGSADDQSLPIYSRPPETFGQDRYLLTNAGGVTGTFDGLHLSIATNGAHAWRFAVTGTAMRSRATAAFRGFHADENDGVLPGDVFSDPNSRTNADGRPFADRGYALKVWAAYSAPHAISLGAVARYADGQPFARLVLIPDLPQGPDVVRAYPNGRSRFTYALTLDLRAEKRFRIADRWFAAAVEAYNALDTRHEVEEDTVTGPRYRTPTAVQPPRVVRVVFRADF